MIAYLPSYHGIFKKLEMIRSIREILCIADIEIYLFAEIKFKTLKMQ